jgi:DNA modification methylase
MKMSIKILQGNCLETLSSLEEKSVNTCVTSPPYWGLRDYGNGDQLGLEETPEQFTENLVKLFREVRRVLRDDGTVWLNLGDSYSSGGRKTTTNQSLRGDNEYGVTRPKPSKGIKEKDLIGIPWRVAFALQADGWYLRQDIIWSKPNPMPESVTDRCTKAHEYIFLLSKSPKYYYDNEAIREPIKPTTTGKTSVRESGDSKTRNKEHWGIPHQPKNVIREYEEIKGANKRSVWTVTTKPYSEAHFATYPHDLIIPCILAGCPEGGTVLDPFGGSGTTAQVASNLNRNAILCELNPEYVEIAKGRLHDSLGMFLDMTVETPQH